MARRKREEGRKGKEKEKEKEGRRKGSLGNASSRFFTVEALIC